MIVWYRCDRCKRYLQEDETEESEKRRLAELEANFGVEAVKENCGRVCDDCYKEIMNSFKRPS